MDKLQRPFKENKDLIIGELLLTTVTLRQQKKYYTIFGRKSTRKIKWHLREMRADQTIKRNSKQDCTRDVPL